MDTERIEKGETPQTAASEAKRIEELRRRVEEWRRTRVRRTRVPAELWVDAIWLAKRLGAYRTARAVGLPYESLKGQVRAAGAAHVTSKADLGGGTTAAAGAAGKRANARSDERVGFVEIGQIRVAGHPPDVCGTVIEIADGEGRRLTLRLGAGMAVDVAGILAAFGRG